MDFEKLACLVEDRTVKIMSNNSDFVKEQHAKELEETLKNNENPIARTFSSYLHTAISLSTLNTIQILNDLGVLSLDEIDIPEVENQQE